MAKKDKKNTYSIGVRTIKQHQIVDVSKWILKKDLAVTKGTRPSRVLKQTKMGKVYFLVKTYEKDVGELRSEICASLIGKLFNFSVQKCWFCLIENYEELGLNYPIGVLIQLDARRQKYTKRNQFRENLIHASAIISEVQEDFRNAGELDKRRFYKLSSVVRAIRNYCLKKKIDNNIWHSFFELLVFDALIGGTDRHYNNWGILENEETGSFIKLAPAFDNGISLLWKFDSYKNRMDGDLFKKNFIRNAESMFKKDEGGKFTLFGLLEAVYMLEEYRGSGLAKVMFDRIRRVDNSTLLERLMNLVPKDKRFEVDDEKLLKIGEYVSYRKKMLEEKLHFLISKYN